MASAPRRPEQVRRRDGFQSSRNAFIEWARSALVPLTCVSAGSHWRDLAPLCDMIGDATVVALSEGVHGSAEPLEFRNRVLQYLVEHKGFTAIAIESGLVEGRIVYDYVRGGPGDLAAVTAQGISWTFDQLPQNRALIQWMRQYNAVPGRVRNVNFYGFDVPGSPGNGKAGRGPDTALREALRYLASVDNGAAAAFHARVGPLIKGASSDAEHPGVWGYEQLSLAERDALTATIADLVTLLERSEARYVGESSARDYEWGYRAAIGARQVDAWFRRFPLGWQRPAEFATCVREQLSIVSAAADVRDRAQADNLEWIIRQEGQGGKILVFAHRGHLSNAPLRWLPNSEECELNVVGTYLRQRYGRQLFTIGNLLGRGELGWSDLRQTLERAAPESMDGLAGEVGAPVFMVDLRAAPAAVAEWLSHECLLGHGPHSFKVAVGKAFDALLYFDTVTAACGRGELHADRNVRAEPA